MMRPSEAMLSAVSAGQPVLVGREFGGHLAQATHQKGRALLRRGGRPHGHELLHTGESHNHDGVDPARLLPPANRLCEQADPPLISYRDAAPPRPAAGQADVPVHPSPRPRSGPRRRPMAQACSTAIKPPMPSASLAKQPSCRPSSNAATSACFATSTPQRISFKLTCLVRAAEAQRLFGCACLRRQSHALQGCNLREIGRRRRARGRKAIQPRAAPILIQNKSSRTVTREQEPISSDRHGQA